MVLQIKMQLPCTDNIVQWSMPDGPYLNTSGCECGIVNVSWNAEMLKAGFGSLEKNPVLLVCKCFLKTAGFQQKEIVMKK